MFCFRTLILSSVKYDGPWFATQLILSASIGFLSFLVFSYCRTRWPLLFAPRTKLKGVSPHILPHPYTYQSLRQVSPHMRPMPSRPSLAGSSLPSESPSLPFYRSLVWMPLWCVTNHHSILGLPAHSPLVAIASQFLQDVILAILVLFSSCSGHPHAY